jgi:transposase
VFNGLRYVVKTGAPWRWMPNDLPPWDIVYGQARRWLAAGVFEAIVYDLRVLLRLEAGRGPEPTAVILDSRTLRSMPESGARAGCDGAKRKKGSKVHAAVDTLGHLRALHVTPATADARAEVTTLPRPSSTRPAATSKLRLWTRAIPASGPLRPLPSTGHSARGRPSRRGQEWLRAAAQAMGGGTLLRLGNPLPPSRPRLRATTRDPRRPPPRRLRLPHASSTSPQSRRFETASSAELVFGSTPPVGRAAAVDRHAPSAVAVRKLAVANADPPAGPVKGWLGGGRRGGLSHGLCSLASADADKVSLGGPKGTYALRRPQLARGRAKVGPRPF